MEKNLSDAYKKELEAINKYNDLKEEERPNWVKKIKPMTFEQRITAMFAPNVYGHADKKMGILRSIVGGSKKENGADNGRRGRIHTTFDWRSWNCKNSTYLPNQLNWILILEWLMLQEHQEKA